MKNYITNYDPFFSRFFLGEKDERNLMSTDIIERKNDYLMKVDLPNVDKKDIVLSLEDGYLTIKASIKEEKDIEGEYLYKERRVGEYSRSYYVGEDVTNKDITAKLSEGVLELVIAKVSPKEKEANIISID